MILVISSKKVYAAQRLAQEAKSQKIKVRIMDVRALAACGFKIDVNKFDVLYIRDPYLNGSPKYIPRIIKLARQFKRAGKRVVDSVIAKGELGQGKWSDYKKLQKAGLPIPQTKQLTISARGGSASGGNNLQLTYPLVLKWTYGFKAKNVFLIENHQQLKTVLPLHPKKEWLVQEFIKAEYEYKVITVGYKALPVILRFNIIDGGFGVDFDKCEVLRSPPLLLTRSAQLRVTPSEVEVVRRGSACPAPELDDWCRGRGCSNSILETTSLPPKADKNPVTLGGISPQEGRIFDVLISLSEYASRLLGRELAKVDILESGGKFYILEVNRFPGLKSFEELAKYNATGDFISYLQK